MNIPIIVLTVAMVAAPAPKTWQVSIDDIVPPWTMLDINPTLNVDNEAEKWIAQQRENIKFYDPWNRNPHKLLPPGLIHWAGKGKGHPPQVPELSTSCTLGLGALFLVWSRNKRTDQKRKSIKAKSE